MRPMATIRAGGRHHPRVCRRPYARMLAVRKHKVWLKITYITDKCHPASTPTTSINCHPSPITHHPSPIILHAKGQMKYCYSTGLMS
ncbi:MAG: hypothetical protein J6C18_11110 [Bacteroidaceae bacterium]|nr:hypothetical protein [Bacteroidaceae bacterium]